MLIKYNGNFYDLSQLDSRRELKNKLQKKMERRNKKNKQDDKLLKNILTIYGNN